MNPYAYSIALRMRSRGVAGAVMSDRLRFAAKDGNLRRLVS